MHVAPISKVIPDFREMAVGGSDKQAKQQSSVTWQLRIQAYVTKEKRTEEAARKALRVVTGQEVRKSNKYYGLALDKALQMGAGLSLAEFKCERPLGPLGDSESRYYAEGVATAEGYMEYRACIEDTASGETRYELPRRIVGHRLLRRSLHVHIDSGSIGFPFCVWAFTRGAFAGVSPPTGFTCATTGIRRRKSLLRFGGCSWKPWLLGTLPPVRSASRHTFRCSKPAS